MQKGIDRQKDSRRTDIIYIYIISGVCSIVDQLISEY